MVDKRLRKLNGIKNEIIPPDLLGGSEYKILVLGWGSTYGSIKEAVDTLENEEISFLYFKQIYPLDPSIKKLLNNAEKNHNI